MKLTIGTILGAVGVVAMGETAAAQSIIRSPEDHSHIGIDVHGTFDYWWGYGFGGGARVEIPIIRNGPIQSVNNSFGLSLGGDLLYRTEYYAQPFWSLVLHIDAQWNFYLSPKWSVFVEAGFAPEFWFGCGPCDTFRPWFDFAVGGRYHFGGGNNGNPALIMRLGFTGANIGVEF